MTTALSMKAMAPSADASAVDVSPRRKVCSICREDLPISAFHKRAHHVLCGVRAACKACTSKRAKEKRDANTPKTVEEAAARQRAAVRRATREAIRTGKLTPKPACEECGDPEVEAHHPRYDGIDPHLEVKWLCRSCHALEHGVRDWTKQLVFRF